MEEKFAKVMEFVNSNKPTVIRVTGVVVGALVGVAIGALVAAAQESEFNEEDIQDQLDESEAEAEDEN